MPRYTPSRDRAISFALTSVLNSSMLSANVIPIILSRMGGEKKLVAVDDLRKGDSVDTKVLSKPLNY